MSSLFKQSFSQNAVSTNDNFDYPSTSCFTGTLHFFNEETSQKPNLQSKIHVNNSYSLNILKVNDTQDCYHDEQDQDEEIVDFNCENIQNDQITYNSADQNIEYTQSYQYNQIKQTESDQNKYQVIQYQQNQNTINQGNNGFQDEYSQFYPKQNQQVAFEQHQLNFQKFLNQNQLTKDNNFQENNQVQLNTFQQNQSVKNTYFNPNPQNICAFNQQQNTEIQKDFLDFQKENIQESEDKQQLIDQNYEQTQFFNSNINDQTDTLYFQEKLQQNINEARDFNVLNLEENNNFYQGEFYYQNSMNHQMQNFNNSNCFSDQQSTQWHQPNSNIIYQGNSTSQNNFNRNIQQQNNYYNNQSQRQIFKQDEQNNQSQSQLINNFNGQNLDQFQQNDINQYPYIDCQNSNIINHQKSKEIPSKECQNENIQSIQNIQFFGNYEIQNSQTFNENTFKSSSSQQNNYFNQKQQNLQSLCQFEQMSNILQHSQEWVEEQDQEQLHLNFGQDFSICAQDSQQQEQTQQQQFLNEQELVQQISVLTLKKKLCEETKNLINSTSRHISQLIKVHYPQFDIKGKHSFKTFDKAIIDCLNDLQSEQEIQLFKEKISDIVFNYMIYKAKKSESEENFKLFTKYSIGYPMMIQNPGKFKSIKDAKKMAKAKIKNQQLNNYH